MRPVLAADTTSGNISLIISLITVGVILGTIIVTASVRFFLGRRSSSGHIRVSEADVLWEQAQQMRVMLLDQVKRAEEQRDKLLQSQTANVLPALTALTASMTAVHELMTRVDATLGRNRDLYTGLTKEIRNAIDKEATRLSGEIAELGKDQRPAPSRRRAPNASQHKPPGD